MKISISAEYYTINKISIPKPLPIVVVVVIIITVIVIKIMKCFVGIYFVYHTKKKKYRNKEIIIIIK